MDSTPKELLQLQARFDHWRANRKYVREPIPAELRKAAVEMSRRYPSSLLRRVLKVQPGRLNKKPIAKHTRMRKTAQPAFFRLPQPGPLPIEISAPLPSTGCRLELERPDGWRLTLSLERLDPATVNSLCSDFLRS
jgi:hypothetical protein